MKSDKIVFMQAFIMLALLMVTSAWCQSRPVKIFWVDSYNQGYAWSDGIGRGIRKILEDKNVEFAAFHMNTKQCKNNECMNKAALDAKKAIEKFEPDVLIASDDNAQKYLVVPHFKNTSLPVIFCGVNWNATGYGYPTENITGMIEVELVQETIRHMRRFAEGDKVGYISGDTASDRKIISWLNKLFFNMKMEAVRVKDYDSFQKEFVRLQDQVDMLFIRNYAGIDGWEELKAKKFISANLKIPTGSNNDFMSPYVIFTLGKIPDEQGEYAALTALKVAEGANISNLPVQTNKKARLTVNLDMARAMNIVLPLSILKVASVIGQESYHQKESDSELTRKSFKGRRVCWVDSYHKGYAWSDTLEKAIKDVFFETDLTFEIFRMDTKRNKSQAQIKKSARQVKKKIDNFNPDLIIASDDNAQKHLIVPFYRETELPVVFCGVNRDVRPYGYPASNITGMIEITSLTKLIALLEPYAKDKSIGYLAGETETERKLFNQYRDDVYRDRLKKYLVSSMAEFKAAFLRAQNETGILYFSNYAGIHDWNIQEAEKFVSLNLQIPSGSNIAHMERLVACTVAHKADEQGRYAALTALKILNGESPQSIPMVKNQEFDMVINLKLSKKTGIIFPLSVIEKARVISE